MTDRRKPEPCECDQVAALREQLANQEAFWLSWRRSAEQCTAVDRREHQEHVRELNDEVWVLRKSLAKAHAAASAAGAQLRAVQEENARLVRDTNTATVAWKKACRRERHYAAQVGGLEAIVEKCLAKMPEGMEHGGCLETAVDLLLARLDRLASAVAEARDHASSARRSGINYDAEEAGAHADDAVRALDKVSGASRGSGESSAPWAGQDAAERDTKPDNPLDDPRMDGKTWIPAKDVTQEMLAAWPVWEWRADKYKSPEQWTILVEPPFSDFGELRPLRLPGMNERGEIAAKNITPEYFERVAEWQCFERGEWQPYQDGMAGLRDEWPLRGRRLMVHAMRLRPAILAKLDHSA